MSSGGQTPVTQQTTQTKDPWSVAQPFLQQGMTTAQQYLQNNTGYTPYSGQTQAALDPTLAAGVNYTNMTLSPDAATGGTAGVNAARALGLQQIQQAGGTNPYLESILATNNRTIGDRINSSMSGAGRYGSGQHTDVMARALAESADPILSQDYTQGLQRAGQWAQLMPALDEARLAPAQGLMSIGQWAQERNQAALNDQIKLYNAQQAYPWEQLSRFNAAVGGAGGLGGTSVTTSPINQPSTLQRVLGGGLAGAGIGSSFGGAPGAAVGAGAGGLLGLL